MADLPSAELGGELSMFGDPKLLTGLSLYDADHSAITVGARHSYEVALDGKIEEQLVHAHNGIGGTWRITAFVPHLAYVTTPEVARRLLAVHRCRPFKTRRHSARVEGFRALKFADLKWSLISAPKEPCS
jgi:hypothetical protein